MVKQISIAKNVFFNGIVQVTSILLNIILLPYITGIFDAKELGINSFGQAIAGYFVLGGNLGITIYGARIIAETRDDELKNQEVFSQCISYQFFFNALALSLYFIWAYFQNCTVYYLFSIIILTSMTDLSWAYTGKERFDLIAIRNFIIKILGTGLIFIFVKNKNQLPLFIILQQGILLLSNIVFWFELRKISLKPRFFNLRKALTYVFIPAFSVFLPSVFSSIYMSLNKIMLGYLSTLSEVAIYDYPNRLIRIGSTLISIIGVVLMPRLSYLRHQSNVIEFNAKIKQLLFTTLICSIPLAILLIILSNNICTIFFHSTLPGASAVIKLMAPTIITSGLCLYVIYVSINRMKTLTISISIGGVLNIIINFWLIRYYNAIGAAVATLLTEVIVHILLIYFLKDIIKIKWFIVRLASILLVGLTCAVITIFVSSLMTIENNYLYVIINFFIYIIAFMLIMFGCYPSEMICLKKNILK